MMKMPFAERAVVPREKVEDYLLSPNHLLGRHKARFFFKLGYTLADAGRLAEDLVKIAQHYPVASEIQTPFGTKFVVDGQVTSPSGITSTIRTVWIVEASDNIPRLVTAYPWKRGKP